LKITIFGLTVSSTWGNGHATFYRAILRALARLGHSVTFYERDQSQFARHRDLPESEEFGVRLYARWDAVRHAAVEEAKHSDVVLLGSHVPEGARIADAILALREPLRVFYEWDTPGTLERLTYGGLEYLRALQLPDFDLILSRTGGSSLSALEMDYGARMALPLFPCVDPEQFFRLPARPQLRCELSYVDGYSLEKQVQLESMVIAAAKQRPSWKFLLAGPPRPAGLAWPKRGQGGSKFPKNVRRVESMTREDRPALYSSSRLTLNLSGKAAAEWGFCPSSQLFEAAACGTPLLTTGFAGLESFFEPGVELLVAADAVDVIAGMERSDASLASMARRAHERTLDEHTGYHRALAMVAAFEQARAPRLLRAAQDAMQPAREMETRGLPPREDCA